MIAIPEEEEVATLESGFHGPGQDDDDGGGGVGEDGEGFPHHEGGGEDEGEVEELLQGLARVGEGGAYDGDHFGSGGWKTDDVRMGDEGVEVGFTVGASATRRQN